MRQTTVTTTGPSALQLQVTAPDALVLMYSPQRVIVTTGGSASTRTEVAVTVVCPAARRTHTERRAFFQGGAEFDISRTLQLLATPVETALMRVDFGGANGLTEVFQLHVELMDTDGVGYPVADYDIRALYGALDGGETYGAPLQRRLWVNLPQTFTTNRTASDMFGVVVGGVRYDVPNSDGIQSAEVDLVQTMLDGGGSLDSLQTPNEVQARVTNGYLLKDDAGTMTLWRDLTLVPDTCPADSGVYLRWLNREGGVSYWMFRKSQSRITSAVRTSVETYLSGLQAAPVNNVYRNARRADYREARELVLGAVGLSAAEHDDLCALAVSPAVEMLVVPEGYAGGRLEGPQKWVQVTVAAGSYARDVRRGTPSRQDLEFIIELPERNTARL